MDPVSLLSIIGSVIGTGLAVGLTLALMAWRITVRLDRRIDSNKLSADADRRAWQATMDTFRQEMLRLAERQSHVEGRLESRTAE